MKSTSIAVLCCALSLLSFTVNAVISDKVKAASQSGKGAYSTKPQPSAIIVKWQNKQSQSVSASSVNPMGLVKRKSFKHLTGMEIYNVPAHLSAKEAAVLMARQPGVESAEPEVIFEVLAIPNDEHFDQLWGLDNQYDTDINAPEAWDITQGNEQIVIGVIDSGIDYQHEDLAPNVWQNPNEIPSNGIDDDGNGYIDDIYGIDTYNNDTDPYDDNAHGTHVAGTIAAKANNSIGIAGVAPNVKIISCKFISSWGWGTSAGAIECLDYFYDLKMNHNINIIATNNSWGGGLESQLLKDAIEKHNQANIAFIAAAGNSSINLDSFPQYPAAYDNENIVSVAAVNIEENLAYFSNYGTQNVDIAAPGVGIYSTIPGNSYEYFSGTSMAAPHVAGAYALVDSLYPDYTLSQKINLISKVGKTQPALQGRVGSGKSLALWTDDNSGSLNCQDSLSTTIVSPVLLNGGVKTAPDEELVVNLSVLDCGVPVIGQSYELFVGGEKVGDLNDAGLDADLTANDGIYSIAFTVDFIGQAPATISGVVSNVFYINSSVEPAKFEKTDYQYQEVVGTPISIYEEESKLIDLGFSVAWPLGTVDNLYISANGLFSADFAFGYGWNFPLPGGSSAHVFLPYHDDLHPANGQISYQVSGEAPNRQVIFDYKNVEYFYPDWDDESTISFQVVMFESKNEIHVNYKDLLDPGSYRSNGGSATVGYEYNGQAVQLLYNEPILDNETSYIVKAVTVAGYPTFNQFELTGGVARPGFEMTFTVNAQASTADNTVSLVSLDLGDGTVLSNPDLGEINHVYSQAGVYKITARISENGKSVYRSINILVEDLTEDEQQIIDLVTQSTISLVQSTPADYGLVSQSQHEIDIATAEQARQDLIVANPENYQLVSQAKYVADISTAEQARQDLIVANPENYQLVSQAKYLADIATAEQARQDLIIANPENYQLVSQAKYLADIATAERARQDLIVANPENYQLVSQAKYVADIATAEQARQDLIVANPENYQLVSQVKYVADIAAAEQARQELIIAKPQDYNLVSQSKYETDIADAELARQNLVIANPLNYNLVSNAQYLADIATAEQARQNLVIANPLNYNLVSQAQYTADILAAENARQALVIANPTNYDLVAKAVHEAAIADAIQLAKDNKEAEIDQNPAQFGLIKLNTLSLIDQTVIEALATGTHLLGSPQPLSEFETLFASVKFIWLYTDELGFSGWAPDQANRDKIVASGYQLLTEIPAGVGFWVKK
ncbi:hypothetical protein C2869_00535 [Saccharobesus litoralis]|uniref:Uncharacterized protein n=1 Tax=Saccharobesus litoralis TaxID=2172099 RepID=A0A2S0VLD5_9ALTE|nr:S8 family serine peptidase [Saccharobesus litoralis]AWB65018.1 hypothetical protein C2869_00535 [Saccharobesus litoralis]